MSKQLDLVAVHLPKWASVTEARTHLDVSISSLPSGKPVGAVALIIRSVAGQIRVSERSAGRRWPTGCPERHINYDGTFCVGEGPINSPQIADDAQIWWEALGNFLAGQRFADRRHEWPYPRSLHHGDASKHQVELERLAKGTEFEADVLRALELRTGWFANQSERPHRTEPRLTNLRNPCPLGCAKGKNRIAKRKCKRKEQMFRLLREEYLRRRAEKKFWASYPRKICCGTMDGCPLRKV